MIILNILVSEWCCDNESLIKYLTTVLITSEPMELYKLNEFSSYGRYAKYINEDDFTMITKKER